MRWLGWLLAAAGWLLALLGMRRRQLPSGPTRQAEEIRQAAEQEQAEFRRRHDEEQAHLEEQRRQRDEELRLEAKRKRERDAVDRANEDLDRLGWRPPGPRDDLAGGGE